MKMLKNFLKIICVMTIILANFSVLVMAKTAVVNTDTLRLRKEASTDSTIVALMDIGDVLDVLEEDGNWCKVKYIEKKNGTTKEIIGYASSDYLKIGEGTVTPVVTESPKPQEEQKPQEELQEEPAPVQEEPKEETKPVENTEQTENQEITETETNEDDNNKEIEEPKKEEEKPEVKEETKVNIGDIKKVSEEKDIYIVPLINALKVSKVNNEDNIKVNQVLNGWAYIETDRGVSGWIRCNLL